MYYTYATMRPLGMLLGVLLLAGIAACDSGGTASSVTLSAPSEPLNDANGHPLLLPNTDPGVTVFETELLRLVNDYRLKMGLSPLIPAPVLGDAARAHCRHMIDHRFFAHLSPEGLTPAERLTLANVDWNSVGENIAAGYSTPQAVFDAWLASPEHRANMEAEGFTYAGAGYAEDADPTPEFPQVHYWSMAFLRR
ncbi:MAG TPA: CAP domain-containing protein [Planctomycetota bacterium]|nr:CAP domain-containing protein [Planctomycetota bacterium]